MDRPLLVNFHDERDNLLGGRVEHVMALRSTLAPSIPVAHETPKVAEQST